MNASPNQQAYYSVSVPRHFVYGAGCPHLDFAAAFLQIPSHPGHPWLWLWGSRQLAPSGLVSTFVVDAPFSVVSCPAHPDMPPLQGLKPGRSTIPQGVALGLVMLPFQGRPLIRTQVYPGSGKFIDRSLFNLIACRRTPHRKTFQAPHLSDPVRPGMASPERAK